MHQPIVHSKDRRRMTQACLVGDSIEGAGRDGDFAATDCAFARNIGVRFLVPEQVFANASDPWAAPNGADPDRGYSEEDLKTLAGRGEKPADASYLADFTRGDGGPRGTGATSSL